MSDLSLVLPITSGGKMSVTLTRDDTIKLIEMRGQHASNNKAVSMEVPDGTVQADGQVIFPTVTLTFSRGKLHGSVTQHGRTTHRSIAMKVADATDGQADPIEYNETTVFMAKGACK